MQLISLAALTTLALAAQLPELFPSSMASGGVVRMGLNAITVCEGQYDITIEPKTDYGNIMCMLPTNGLDLTCERKANSKPQNCVKMASAPLHATCGFMKATFLKKDKLSTLDVYLSTTPNDQPEPAKVWLDIVETCNGERFTYTSPPTNGFPEAQKISLR